MKSDEYGNGNFIFDYLKWIFCLFMLKFFFVNIGYEKEIWYFYLRLK